MPWPVGDGAGAKEGLTNQVLAGSGKVNDTLMETDFTAENETVCHTW